MDHNLKQDANYDQYDQYDIVYYISRVQKITTFHGMTQLFEVHIYTLVPFFCKQIVRFDLRSNNIESSPQ